MMSIQTMNMSIMTLLMVAGAGCATAQPAASPIPASEPGVAPEGILVPGSHATPEPARAWSWIQIDALEERLGRGERFIFMNLLDGCGANPGVFADLDAFVWDEAIGQTEPVPIYVLAHDPQTRVEELPERTRALLSTWKFASPIAYFVDGGRAVDVTGMMVYTSGFERFMKRNFAPMTFRPELGERPSATALRKSLTRNKHVYRNMAGLNASGYSMVDPSFEGSDLRNADFTGSTLHRPNFSHADLTGADFTQATFTGPPFWGSCTCPDGTRSDEHGMTCQGHLTPARVEGIATDAGPSAKELKARAFIESVREAYQGKP
jgi:hypothetical protein